MVVRPACQPGSPCLECEHAYGFPAGFNDVRPPGLFREAGQGHAQRIADEIELSRSQLQERYGTELDGARVRPQVVEGNQPD